MGRTSFRNLTWARWRRVPVPGSSRVRQVVQLLFFLVFVYLLFAALQLPRSPSFLGTSSGQGRVAFPLADLFFRFNPLSGLASMIAAGGWIPRLGLGLITLGLTVVLGRVWCGWICPMGTLLEWLRFPRSPSFSLVLPRSSGQARDKLGTGLGQARDKSLAPESRPVTSPRDGGWSNTSCSSLF